jgi:hypothetical protein
MVREHSIRQVWDDLAFPELTRSLKLAIGPTKVTLAFLFVLLLCGGGFIMDLLTRSVTVIPDPASALAGQGDPFLLKPDELSAYLENPSRTHEYIQIYREHSPGRGVFNTLWNYFAARFNHATTRLLELRTSNLFANLWNVLDNLWLCFRALAWAVRYHPFYSAVYFTFAFLLFCFFGGAICRCAALDFSRNERPGLGEALQFAREQYRAFLTAPLIPLAILAGISLLLMLIGLAGNIPRAGELILALLIGILFLLGLAMTVLLFATLAGGSLLFPAVAYERTTGLDAIGRAFSYVINQPVWMVFYSLVELILGTLFYLFIRLFVFLILRLTYLMLSFGFTDEQIGKLRRIWAEPTFFHLLNPPLQAVGWSEQVAAFLIYLSLLFIVGLVMAMMISYFFSSITILYGLMRKKVDKIGFTQVDIQLEKIRKTS